MSGLESASQPSMEEILASIRKIIAEDPDGVPRAREAPANAGPPGSFAHRAEGDDGDMDLPSILRSSSPLALERAPPLFNRLADVLRGGTSQAASMRGPDGERSLEDDLSDLLDAPSPPRTPAAALEDAAPLPETGSMAMSGFAVNIPQAQQLLASLDESLAQWSDPNWARDMPSRPDDFPPAPWGSASVPGEKSRAPAALAPVPPARETSAPKPAARPVIKAEAPPAPRPSVEAKAAAEAKPVEDPKPAPKPAAEAKPAPKPAPKPAAEIRLASEGSAAPNPPPAAKPAAEPKPAPPAARASVISGVAHFMNGVTGEQGAAKAANASGRSLDDAVAELLRPMLRQWVDENMPRIMETALRAEVAAAVKEAVKSQDKK